MELQSILEKKSSVETSREAPRSWIVKWVSFDLTDRPYLYRILPDAHLWSRNPKRALGLTYEIAAAIAAQYEGDAILEYRGDGA